MDKWQVNFGSKLSRLKDNTKFNKSSRQLVLEYIQTKKAQNVGCHRLNRILDLLWHLLGNFKYDLKGLSEDRIEEIAIWINGNPEWKDWTKYTYIGVLSNFASWLNSKYKLGLTIKLKRKTPKNSIMPEYLLSDDELERMLNGSTDEQTKLFLNVVYESGVRIGEILNLKIQNIEFSVNGARLFLKGKIGQRVVPVVWCANNLRQFIGNHPFKENPEAILWYFRRGDDILPVNYEVMRTRLRRIAKKVGVKKRVHWHLFRHQRFTDMAKHNLGESNMRRLAGWSEGSKMVKTYINLSNTDVENSLLERMYGIKVSSDNGGETLRVCSKCNEVNPNFYKLCKRCNTPLSEKELVQEAMSVEKLKEVEEGSKVLLAFLKRIEKRYPDIWNDFPKDGKEEDTSKVNELRKQIDRDIFDIWLDWNRD